MTYMIAPGLIMEGYRNVIDYDVFLNRLDVDKPVSLSSAKFYEMWQIFKEVCTLYEQDPKEIYLTNGQRNREFVVIRQLSMTLFRKRLDNSLYSLTVCGRFFNKDHTTCLHSITTVDNLRETNRIFREFTDEIYYR